MAGSCAAAAEQFPVLGRAGMDLYADPPGTRTEEAHFTSALGGSAANIAVALWLGAGRLPHHCSVG
jgi:5-dehydro-2-deoxygluconokinase